MGSTGEVTTKTFNRTHHVSGTSDQVKHQFLVVFRKLKRTERKDCARF